MCFLRLALGDEAHAFDARGAHGGLDGPVLLPEPEQGLVCLIAALQLLKRIFRPVLYLDLDLSLESV